MYGGEARRLAGAGQVIERGAYSTLAGSDWVIFASFAPADTNDHYCEFAS